MFNINFHSSQRVVNLLRELTDEGNVFWFLISYWSFKSCSAIFLIKHNLPSLCNFSWMSDDRQTVHSWPNIKFAQCILPSYTGYWETIFIEAVDDICDCYSQGMRCRWCNCCFEWASAKVRNEGFVVSDVHSLPIYNFPEL